MPPTPASLLFRLRANPAKGENWQRLDFLYRPLLNTRLRRYAILPQDAENLVQEVLQVLARELPGFDYDPRQGRFRDWLKAIMVNRLRESWRSERHRPQATGDSDFHRAKEPLARKKFAPARSQGG